MLQRRRFLSLALLIFAAQTGAIASSFSFTGTFTSDTDVQFFTFTLLNDTPNVSLVTWGYGGGTNAAGANITSGGFAPILALYMSDGTGMNPGTSGPCAGTPLNADPVTGACEEVYYPTSLSFPGGSWTAGTYTVALTVAPNGPLGNLSDGFFADGVLGF